MKTKILFVNNNLHVGGVQKSLVNLLRAIKDDYDITLYLFSKKGEYVKDVPDNVKIIEATYPLRTLGMSMREAEQAGVRFALAKILFGITARIFGGKIAVNIAVNFSNINEEFDYAVSYQHPGPKHLFYGGSNEFVIKKVKAKQKIGFIHCDYENFGGDVEYSKKLYQSFNDIAFCSIGCKETFTKIISSFEKKSLVIYNSHDIEQILLLANKNPRQYNKRVFNIVLVSRLSYEKGIQTAIESISEYIKKYDGQLHLHIVGDGKDRTKLEKLSDGLGLKNNVTFYGKQKNPYRYMANADLLILTSFHEAAPMVFDEAYILHLPILATPTTSTKEMVLDRKAGWVCQNEPGEIAEYLRAIILGNKSVDSIYNPSIINNGLTQFKQMINNSEGTKL